MFASHPSNEMTGKSLMKAGTTFFTANEEEKQNNTTNVAKLKC